VLAWTLCVRAGQAARPDVATRMSAKPACVQTLHSPGLCKQAVRAAMLSIYLISPRGITLLITQSQSNKHEVET